jgi:hypothetical protein
VVLYVLMKKLLLVFCLLTTFGITVFVGNFLNITSGAPPYQVADDPPGPDIESFLWRDWKRPEGPAKVALQVGHWKSGEVPDELHRLRGNTGASGGGKSEWEVNMSIVSATAEILKDKGIVVEILPATVPPEYWADVFVSVHADGNLDLGKSGFKAASPRRDMTGKSGSLLNFVEDEYSKATGLPEDPNVTRNMRGYYAFGWWRYEHAVHPMTTSIILETGFLTSPSDRKVIVDQAEIAAFGLAEGIIKYLTSEKLI